jgi:hypothetical protein
VRDWVHGRLDHGDVRDQWAMDEPASLRLPTACKHARHIRPVVVQLAEHTDQQDLQRDGVCVRIAIFGLLAHQTLPVDQDHVHLACIGF